MKWRGGKGRAFLLVVAGLLMLPGCEWYDFQQASRKRTIAAYRDFVRRHPSGKYASMAWKQIDFLSYHRARQQNTISAYREYLEEFPDGEHSKDAHKEIRLILRRWVDGLSEEEMVKARIVVETSAGSFVFRLRPETAPGHTRNMIFLAASGFYVGQEINWVVENQMIGLGDPAGTGLGGPGYMIPAEINPLPHQRGTVSMYHLPVDPDTAGSQFFICLTALPQFDEKYTVFGEVTDGLETLDHISRVETSPEGGITGRRPAQPIRILKFEVQQLTLPE